MEKQYLLFKMEKVPKNVPVRYGFIIPFLPGSRNTEGEEWKDEEEDEPEQVAQQSYLCFLSKLKKPTDIIEWVEKDPRGQYYIFEGVMQPVQVAMPVFIGGKNLTTMEDEWEK